jgi:hypothetical protein
MNNSTAKSVGVKQAQVLQKNIPCIFPASQTLCVHSQARVAKKGR